MNIRDVISQQTFTAITERRAIATVTKGDTIPLPKRAVRPSSNTARPGLSAPDRAAHTRVART